MNINWNKLSRKSQLTILQLDRAKTQNSLDLMEERETVLLAQLALLDAKIEKHRDTDIMMKAHHRTAVEDYAVLKETPGPSNRITFPPGKIEAMAEELYPTKDENDPHGTKSHEPGAKLDAGKPLAGLVLGDFSRALQGVVDVGTFGAKKYSPSGWVKVPGGANRYKDALYRHLLTLEKTPLDADSGLPHLAQVCWNALAWFELVLRRQEMEADEAREGINEDAGC